MTALFSRQTTDADAVLRSALGRVAPAEPVVGVEHEFAVFRDGRQVDFRELIHEIEIDGRVLHPTNEHMYLTTSGAALLADGMVAEIATPPLARREGVATEAARWADQARRDLAAGSPSDLEFHGGSTHISITTDPHVNDRLAVAFARTFGPALMLLMDQPHSPGMLVRPRPGRIELCGEYVVGDSLTIATVFALGAVETLERAIRGHGEPPPFLDVVLEPGRRRYGWYIDRNAYGGDLYTEGRSSELRLAAGGTTTAGEWLTACWAMIRPAAQRVATTAEMAAVDACVAGQTGLPLERGLYGVIPDDAARLSTEPIGVAAQTLSSRSVTLTPRVATWEWAVWEAHTDGGEAVVLIPRDALRAFERAFSRGDLDQPIAEAVDQRSSLATLSHTTQLGFPSFFAEVQTGTGLLPNDRMGIGNAPASTSRPDKRELPADRPAGRTGTAANVLVLLALLVGLVASVAVPAAAQGTQDPRSVPVSVQPIEIDGELWVVIEFADGWVSGMPLDLFSLFFELGIQFPDLFSSTHWEVHDGVVQSFASRPLLLLDDGRLLASMHSEVPTPLDFTATMATGSWPDASGSAEFSDHTFPINDSTLLGPEAIAGTTAIFDLRNNMVIETVEPINWMGFGTIFPDLPFTTAGDPTVTDPPGDAVDYYGVFDSSYPDVTSVDAFDVAFGSDFPASARMDRLSHICMDGLGAGAAPVCPVDLGPLSNASGWTFLEITFPESTSVVQAGLAWADPSRPVFDGPPNDPNTGHNESLDLFNNGSAYEVGATGFSDDSFIFGPTNDALAIIRPDGVSLILNNDSLVGCESPTVFTVNAGGLDLIDIPESAPGSILVGKPTPDPSSSTESELPGSGTVDESSSEDPTATEDDADQGSDSTTSTTAKTDSESGTPLWPWLIGFLGIVFIGGGVYLLKTDDGTSSSFPVVAGFEKGTSGYSHVAVGGGT